MIKKIIIFVIPLFLTFTMCKKDKILTSIDEKKHPDISQIALTDAEYEALYDSVLMAVQWGLLDLSKSATFKALVNTEVGYEFDGDVNVLLKKLVENWPDLEADMSTSISLHYSNPDLLTKFVDEAVNGFTYFDMFVYPQIYIPFDDQVTLTDNPVLTLNLNDSIILPGIYINESNALVSQTVDEDFAEENLVWVISMNETLKSEADFENYNDFGITCEHSTDSTFDTSVVSITSGDWELRANGNRPQKLFKSASREVGIEFLKFKSPTAKENWGGGKCDVSWVGGQWNDVCDPPTVLGGDPIMKIKRKKIKDWHDFGTGVKVGNKRFLASFENLVLPYAWNECAWVLIFESDVRKKWGKSFTPPSFDGLDDCNNTFYYGSKDSPYGDINMHWVWFYSHLETLHTNPRTIDCNMNGGDRHVMFKVFK